MTHHKPFPRRIVVIWACFVARLAFYATALPLWEGYDEWAHFSVVRTVALRGLPLVPRGQPVPRDVEASLELAPVPWELRYLAWPSVTQDAYWALPAEARAQREAAFQAIPPAWSRENGTGKFTAYEALQPPLYYWLMAPAVRAASHLSLARQVLIVRWLSILIASLTIPLTYAIARAAFRQEAMALACAATVALMPGFAMDVARVGNDCLAVVLFSLLIWIGLRLVTAAPTNSAALALGLALGLGLLTKAYFLTAIPAIALLAWRIGWRRTAIPLLAAALISGWWYVRNLLTTGTLSGLSEAVLLRGVPGAELIRRAWGIHWLQAIDAILFSHIYFGGWSSLTVRSWMYHVFYAVILIALFGLLRMVRQPAIRWLIAIYAAFWLGQLYNVVLLYLTKGLSGSMGWYLYAVVAAEAVLVFAGLSRFPRWLTAAAASLFGLLDLYTLHCVAIPYYTGLIGHKPNGALAALHVGNFHGVFARLTAFKAVPVPVIVVLWIAYLGATVWLVSSLARNMQRQAR